jgi:hypothetical protein
MRRVAMILAPLALVAAVFVALALAADAPGDCPSFKHGRRAARSIQAHGLGNGLSCAQVRAALGAWIEQKFPARAAGWRFDYRADCSCHVANRRLPDGRRQRFVFS